MIQFKLKVKQTQVSVTSDERHTEQPAAGIPETQQRETSTKHQDINTKSAPLIHNQSPDLDFFLNVWIYGWGQRKESKSY